MANPDRRREMPAHTLHRETESGHKRPRERGAHHDAREAMGREGPHESRENRGRSEDGVRASREPWNSGSDASYIEPRFIPDYELLARDDSGGPEFEPYTQQFGDGGYVTGDKAHLSAHGGSSDELEGDEIDKEERDRMPSRKPGPGRSSREAGRE